MKENTQKSIDEIVQKNKTLEIKFSEIEKVLFKYYLTKPKNEALKLIATEKQGFLNENLRKY